MNTVSFLGNGELFEGGGRIMPGFKNSELAFTTHASCSIVMRMRHALNNVTEAAGKNIFLYNTRASEFFFLLFDSDYSLDHNDCIVLIILWIFEYADKLN